MESCGKPSAIVTIPLPIWSFDIIPYTGPSFNLSTSKFWRWWLHWVYHSTGFPTKCLRTEEVLLLCRLYIYYLTLNYGFIIHVGLLLNILITVFKPPTSAFQVTLPASPSPGVAATPHRHGVRRRARRRSVVKPAGCHLWPLESPQASAKLVYK